MNKKKGRPTNNPKPNRLSIRLTDKDLKKLQDFCKKNNINKTQAISIGINKLDI